MDIVIVTHRADLALLRICLESIKSFYRDLNRIHVVADRRCEPHMEQVCSILAERTEIYYRDRWSELAEFDSFTQQLCIKLLSWELVSTPRFLILDSDFLFVRPLHDRDFLNAAGIPYWFYGPWGEEASPARRWKPGSEAVLGESVPAYYGEYAQWVFDREVAKSLCDQVGARQLTAIERYSEFTVYGWYARRWFPERYDFVDPSVASRAQPIVEKINQIPPTYCVLDPEAKLQDYPKVGVAVFWSHWELCAAKMRAWLTDAKLSHGISDSGGQRDDPILDPVKIPADLAAIAPACSGISGDGWMAEHVCIAVESCTRVIADIEVPGHPTGGEEGISLRTECWRIDLAPGRHRVSIPTTEGTIRMFVAGGFSVDGPDPRRFRGRLLSLYDDNK